MVDPPPKKCPPPLKSIMRPAGWKPYLASPSERVVSKTKCITLVEDTFGTLYDKCGKPSPVKRFTWRNQNNIQAQVITYGARVTSIKIPDRSGCPDDVVLGFDDLAGYLYYDNLYIGATIGRTSNGVQNATFAVDGKQYWLLADEKGQHYNGGKRGFDKVNWIPYVNGNQVMLSNISRDHDQGYPGDLFVKITYELTVKNEFKIGITANTTKITPVDITNLIFFNLAGHEKGETELRKHILMLNANCYTPKQLNGFPTGEILNVVHSRFDFQTPKLLNNMMGTELNGGYDQNYCVNRGVDQDEAFVARVTHPFTGRVLEVYSNQYGVNFYTCDRFGPGRLDLRFPNFDLLSVNSETVEANGGIFLLIKKLQEYFANTLQMSEAEYIEILKGLTSKLLNVVQNNDDDGSMDLRSCSYKSDRNADFDYSILLLPFELQLLMAMIECIPLISYDMNWLEIREIIDSIIRKNAGFDDMEEEEDHTAEEDPGAKNVYDTNMYQLISHDKMPAPPNSVSGDAVNEAPLRKSFGGSETSNESSTKKTKSVFPIPTNSIPKFYQDGRIHGKDGVIYKQYGAMSLQTQNYPNSMYYKKFPSAIVKPDQTYTHSITYKFWIQSGNPKKWLARMNLDECLEKTV